MKRCAGVIVSDAPLVSLDYGAGSIRFGLCLNLIEVESLRRAWYLAREASRCKHYGSGPIVVLSPWHGRYHVSVFANPNPLRNGA